MGNWNGLLRKEFRLTRTLLLGGLIIDLFIMVGFFLASPNWEVPYLTAIIGGVLASLHFFFIPIYLLISLNTEGRNLHLWLHNPQSGKSLLGAKVLNGLFALVLSLGIVGTLSVLAYFLENSAVELPINNVWLLGLYFLIVIIAGSIYSGIWLTFYWTLYQVMKTYIGKWALVVIFGIAAVLSWLGSWFSETTISKIFTQWGTVQLPTPLDTSFSQQEFDLSVSTFPFHIGSVVFDVIILVAVFLVSCWLLDRKVEV